MAIQRVPGKGELKRYLNSGMTQAQIVEAWADDSGERVSRSAIAMAIARFGLKSAHQRPEYRDLLPWTVAEEHRHHIDARMLRLEGRRRAGGELSEGELRWLTNWKNELERVNAVVHYERDTDEGFFWVPREAHTHDLIWEDPPGSNGSSPQGTPSSRPPS